MCPTGCGPLYKPGADLRDTTCPCGFGYFDRFGLFVAGDRVRGGQALSRESYAIHCTTCPVHADPRNRDAETMSLHHDQNRGFQDYFLPETGIDFEVLKIYVARDGASASARPAPFNERSGYLIHAKQRPTVEFLSNIKADSSRVLKLRQRYGSRMPNWVPEGPGLQVQRPRDMPQDPRSTITDPKDRGADVDSRWQPVPALRPEPTSTGHGLPSNPDYGGTTSWAPQQPQSRSPNYPPSFGSHPARQPRDAGSAERRDLSDRQTSLADRFDQFSLSQRPDSDPYSSATQSPYRQSAVPEVSGHQQRRAYGIASPSSFSAMDPRVAMTEPGELVPQTVPGYNHQGGRMDIYGQTRWTERPLQATTAPVDSPTLLTGDQSHAPPRDGSYTRDPRIEQPRNERGEQAPRPDRAYTDPRDPPTVVTLGTRRPYADPRDQPPEEEDGPSKRPSKRHPRR